MSKLSTLSEAQWKQVFSSKVNYFDFGLQDLWNNKYLLYLLIRKQFVLKYKQTILGPTWALIQPLVISVIFLVIFNKSLGVSTGGTPPLLFYLVGNMCWSIFASGFSKVSTFIFAEQYVLLRVNISKPLMAISGIMVDLLMSILPFLLTFAVMGYYASQGAITVGWSVLLVPVLLLGIIVFVLGIGYIAARLSIKYRDISNVFAFILQMLMYLSAVIYPLSSIENPFNKKLLMLNPMVGYLESLRYVCMGDGYFSWWLLGYDFLITAILFVIGNVMIRQVDKIYADVI